MSFLLPKEGEIVSKIISFIKKHEKVDKSKITPTAHFKKDLGLDSLEEVEV